MSARLLRMVFLWVGMTCLAVSLDFSMVQIVGFAFVGVALMPDD